VANVVEADETQVGAAIGMNQTIRGDDDFLLGGAHDWHDAAYADDEAKFCNHAKFPPFRPETAVYCAELP
jgi:hypothetical protein